MSASDFRNSLLNKELDPLESRLARAKDEKTAPFVLKSLSKDPDCQVRSYVAANSGTPEGCLWDLTYDSDVQVREIAFQTLERLGLKLPGHKIPTLSQARAAEEKKNAELFL